MEPIVLNRLAEPQVNVLGTTRSTVYLAFAYTGRGGREIAAPEPSDPVAGPWY